MSNVGLSTTCSYTGDAFSMAEGEATPRLHDSSLSCHVVTIIIPAAGRQSVKNAVQHISFGHEEQVCALLLSALYAQYFVCRVTAVCSTLDQALETAALMMTVQTAAQASGACLAPSVKMLARSQSEARVCYC